MKTFYTNHTRVCILHPLPQNNKVQPWHFLKKFYWIFHFTFPRSNLLYIFFWFCMKSLTQITIIWRRYIFKRLWQFSKAFSISNWYRWRLCGVVVRSSYMIHQLVNREKKPEKDYRNQKKLCNERFVQLNFTFSTRNVEM